MPFFLVLHVPSVPEFPTLTFILFVDIHGKTQNITCGIYPGVPMHVPCTR